jgi:CHAD domain-containing protein
MRRYKSYSPLEKALIAQLFHLKANTRKVLHNHDPHLLHDLRGAILRIDFALKYFNKWINAKKKIREQVKNIRQKMGKVRRLDIFLSRIDKDFSRMKVKGSLQKTFRQVVQKMHDLKRKELVGVLKSSSYKNMLEELDVLIGYSKLPSTSPALKDIIKRIKEAWKNKKLDSKCLHPLRILFKELRYSSEFIHNHEQIDHAVEFQDILGERQDAISTIDLLSTLPLNKFTKLKHQLIQSEKSEVKKYENKFYKKWQKTPLKKFLVLSPQ